MDGAYVNHTVQEYFTGTAASYNLQTADCAFVVQLTQSNYPFDCLFTWSSASLDDVFVGGRQLEHSLVPVASSSCLLNGSADSCKALLTAATLLYVQKSDNRLGGK